MDKRLFNLEPSHSELLRVVSRESHLSASELLRRMIDLCCRDEVIDDLVPECSGQISFVGK